MSQVNLLAFLWASGRASCQNVYLHWIIQSAKNVHQRVDMARGGKVVGKAGKAEKSSSGHMAVSAVRMPDMCQTVWHMLAKSNCISLPFGQLPNSHAKMLCSVCGCRYFQQLIKWLCLKRIFMNFHSHKVVANNHTPFYEFNQNE